MGGWRRGWVGGGAGGKPEEGQSLHKDTDSSAVCSVSDINRLNP